MPAPPGPLLRRGPRPLLLHLTLAMLKSSASLIASQSLSSASPNWSAAAAEQARAIAAALQGGDGAFPQAVLMEALRQDRELIAGIAAYRRHPWRRVLPEVPAIWEEGGSRLLDFGGTGPTVLLVPSLVNRAHVLDLAPRHSMARFLAGEGLRVLLLDWGWPGELERSFTLTDYIAGRLERALTAVGGRVVLAGYCMGGLLTVAAAQRRPDLVAALALLATPWDFHGDDPTRATALARLLPLMEPLLAFGGALPIDALQIMFALLDPFGIATKYRGFGRLNQDSDRARLFVALEDWLNDGVPLAGPVARECLNGWYGANTPARGTWRVAGLAVDPAALDLPCFVAVPGRDRIVPPESARPLAAAIPNAVLHEPAAGHIGMAAGSTAEAVLWRPFLDWVRGL
ncbi:alpha/beta fold hydrolase [Limobrevibacterium gyesilva]|uniref:Alpha/beta fold hydrolase n=1 Tax=Limobrevibacterium gyesilva TaxID=2991712 RepID=A0AA41YW14_9PROT|nr:alpha/beta fold hydrolase [Limobrevibacterium gyesilva]MCW3477518.1 alpha/beta fold hydrolase [Limobrevibacterium gyesilva]